MGWKMCGMRDTHSTLQCKAVFATPQGATETGRMEKLVNCFYRRPDAVSRLICFPWAGGGSLHYAQWGKLFDSSIEVFSIRLPGRESRCRELFAADMDHIVKEVTSVLLPQLKEKPFAFFGHSFGSLISFAVAHKLKENHGLEPTHLFVSGAPAPHLKSRNPAQKRSDYSDEEFLKWLTAVGGTPPEILANQELLKLVLPVLRADLKIVENFFYEKPPKPVFSCAVTCFDGTSDVPHDLEAWKDLTSGEVDIHKLPGGHFYLKDPANEHFLVKHITKSFETAEMSYF
ncbi:S-acyl fatty acid synthase thioesterase, medium chain [Ambystoma mexicanum]|uniref:S-acyl fatty acid synthase thioesterase, medium chain n=1 Tax=Ambystoma mexicanum TaxID=8296 RepID=UPI0037E917AE